MKNPAFLGLTALLLFLSGAATTAQASSFDFALGGYGSWGSMSDTTASIASVHESTIGGYFLPSYRILPRFGLGAYAEYDSVGQLTSTNSVGGNNESCSGYLAGVAATLGGSKIKLTAAYTFLGSSTLSEKTSTGSAATLKSPKGIHLMLSLGVFRSLSFDLAFASVKYSTEVGTVAASDSRTIKDYRVGGSVHF